MRRFHAFAPSIVICFALSLPAHGETALARAFAEAWQLQPASASFAERQRAAAARLGAAGAWTAAPPSLEIATRSDRFNRDRGARENEVGLVLPLWLPGERSASQAAAAAEAAWLDGRHAAQRLELAAILREAWWGWQAARNDVQLAEQRVAAAEVLRQDVARRFAAGDLARADLNQAASALALARAQQAENLAALAEARYRLESLGASPEDSAAVQPEPLPESVAAATVESARVEEAHPRLRELRARSEAAQRDLELARRQSRANPEIAVSTRRDRALAGERSEQTWALALRIPLAEGPRQEAKVATANAEAIEAGILLEREAVRLGREAATARSQLQAATQQLRAASERAALARETRAFYEKSFRLGESDLPTRLRIESEAFEAERALGRAQVGEARSLSRLRQSLGLLPE